MPITTEAAVRILAVLCTPKPPLPLPPAVAISTPPNPPLAPSTP
jgi:hypothetical protein